MKCLLEIISVVVVLSFATLTIQAQIVPIDLSQAVEFKTVWKKALTGSAAAPNYVASPCEAGEMDYVSIPTSTGGAAFFTRPRIDTSRKPTPGMVGGVKYDYDGVHPFEHLLQSGRVDKCIGVGDPYSNIRGIDTIACWGNLDIRYSGDVDGDGYLDVVCAGDGTTAARIVRGGPMAGKGCERTFSVPAANAMEFYQSASGTWRMVLYAKETYGGVGKPPIREDKIYLYDVLFSHVDNKVKVDYVKRDSLVGWINANHDNPDDQSFNMDCVELTDTEAKKDWFLVYRRVYEGFGWALERFDVTDGRFVSSGEKVSGVELGNPWVAGYTLGTSKPVVSFHAMSKGTVYCFADNLTQPFAWWNPAGSGIQPAAGKVAINDQTGDGKPDLIIAGGSVNGAVLLLTLDPSITTVEETASAEFVDTVRMIGNSLVVLLAQPEMVSAQLVTTDGRISPLLPPTQGVFGENSFDLTSTLMHFPTGAFHVRVRIGTKQSTINLLR